MRLNVIKNKTHYFGRLQEPPLLPPVIPSKFFKGQRTFSLSHSLVLLSLTFTCLSFLSRARKEKNKGRMEYERAEESAATIARHSFLGTHSRTRDSQPASNFRPCISEIMDPALSGLTIALLTRARRADRVHCSSRVRSVRSWLLLSEEARRRKMAVVSLRIPKRRRGRGRREIGRRIACTTRAYNGRRIRRSNSNSMANAKLRRSLRAAMTANDG